MISDDEIVAKARAIVALAKAQGTPLTDQQCNLEIERTLRNIALHKANMDRSTARYNADNDRRYRRGMRAWQLSRAVVVLSIIVLTLAFYYGAVDNAPPPGQSQVYYPLR